MPTTPFDPDSLSPDLATRFADIALGHVRREFPHYLAHVVAEPLPATRPSDLHPIFYGSFDWHSCVHAYWLLARLLRVHPHLQVATRIRELFDEQLTPEKVEVERAYFDAPGRRSFERPYGWAWVLKLAAELKVLSAQSSPSAPATSAAPSTRYALGEERWSTAFAPLAERIAAAFKEFLPLATYPVRVGTHGNTAFALRLAADYAETVGDDQLAALLGATARRWYQEDEGCTAWGEPSGNDFLSPALIEAECMRRLMPMSEFSPWLERFLPNLSGRQPHTLFTPATVTDRSDGQIAHLDGLNLSRAWCWRSLAGALDPNDARRQAMEAAATEHLTAGLEHVAGDYMGEHWLASFAALALDEVA